MRSVETYQPTNYRPKYRQLKRIHKLTYSLYEKLETEDQIAILTSGLLAGALKNDNCDCFRRFKGGPADPAIFQLPALIAGNTIKTFK